MKFANQPDIGDLLADTNKVMRAVTEAVENCLRLHKLLGQPVVEWRDGQVVWVPAEEIVLSKESNGEPPQLPML